MTRRLIEDDFIATEAVIGEKVVWVVPYKDIYEAPTVDAIPVEWIKQFIKKENIDIIHKVGVVDMVEQWKLHPIDFEISSEKCLAKMDGADHE